MLLFFGTLHWPAGGVDLGVGGISYVELLILYELWAGEMLSVEKAHPRYLRPGRPISVSAVPFGPGIDIRRSCRFIGAMIRSLCLLLVGFGGLCLAPLLIIAGFVILGGRSVAMDSLLGLEKVPRSPSRMSYWDFNYPPESAPALACWYSSPSVLCYSLCMQDTYLAVTSCWSCYSFGYC